MAKLRRWQQTQRGPQAKTMSPDRILMLGGCAAFGMAVFIFLQPGSSGAPTGVVITEGVRARAVQTPAEQAKTLAAAQKAEAEARNRESAKLRVEAAREQARIFNQRYNTDRMPVGSVTQAEPVAPAPQQGFTVVKPAIPPGQSGGGFREVKWPRTPGQ